MVLSICINESEFGSSTSANVSINLDTDTIVGWKDTSSNETNWSWDGWGDYNPIGKSISEFIEDMDNWFNTFEDEFRRPFVCIDRFRKWYYGE